MVRIGATFPLAVLPYTLIELPPFATAISLFFVSTAMPNGLIGAVAAARIRTMPMIAIHGVEFIFASFADVSPFSNSASGPQADGSQNGSHRWSRRHPHP